MKASQVGEQGLGNLSWDMNNMAATYTDEKVKELLGIWQLTLLQSMAPGVMLRL